MSEPANPEQRREYVARLNRALGGVLTRESFTLSQSFYIGRVKGVEYRAIDVAGHCVDEAADLEPQYFVNNDMRATAANSTTGDAKTLPALFNSFVRGEGRHDAMLALSTVFVKEGLRRHHIEPMFSTLVRLGPPSEGDHDLLAEVPRIVESAVGKYGDKVGERVGKAELVGGDNVEPEAINWIWKGWLARGKLHLLAGVPSVGKSTCLISWAATISRGGTWPDGTKTEAGIVVVWSSEDAFADTILPRFMAAGGDRCRIHYVAGMKGKDGKVRPFNPARDMGALSEALHGLDNVRLIIVDPIVSVVKGDSHKVTETRNDLQPLVDLAVAHDCAVYGITHFRKGSQSDDLLERIVGSGAFGALPRVVVVAARDAEGNRLVVNVKGNNNAKEGAGFAYDIETTYVKDRKGTSIETSRIDWGAALKGDARELLGMKRPDNDPETVRFLRELLVDGPMNARDVQARAAEAGFTDDQMTTARKKLHVQTNRKGFGPGSKLVWSLPENQVALSKSVRALTGHDK